MPGMGPKGSTALQTGRLSKLRSSCNSCGTAKVKCDRQRPSCRRCHGLGVACVYGPSRKSGRPPRKGATDTGPALGLTPGPRNPYLARTISSLPTMTCENVSTPSDRNSVRTPRAHWGNRSEVADMGGVEQLCPDDLSWANPHISGPWMDLNSPSHPLVEHDVASRDPSATWDRAHTVGWRDVSASQNSHVCSRESYQILADLICPAPHLHPPQTNAGTVSAFLDEILLCNRKAIDRLTPLLRCSCARSVHRIMLHASIISKILMWYQQAAAPVSGLNRSTDQTSPSMTANSDLDSHVSEDLIKATGFVVIDTPATLGTFSIDDPSLQARIRNEIVLGELDKMLDLVELFSSLAPDTGGIATGVASLYAPAASWIKDEYDRIIETLRATCDRENSSAMVIAC